MDPFVLIDAAIELIFSNLESKTRNAGLDSIILIVEYSLRFYSYQVQKDK